MRRYAGQQAQTQDAVRSAPLAVFAVVALILDRRFFVAKGRFLWGWGDEVE